MHEEISKFDVLLSNLNQRENEKKKVYAKKVDSIKCDICNYEASSKTVLKHHRTMKHNVENIPDPPAQQPLPCVSHLDGCTMLVKSYFSDSTAICLPCKENLEVVIPFLYAQTARMNFQKTKFQIPPTQNLAS